MRIFHFTTFGEGGAANAVKRLHEALLDAGVESNIYCRFGHMSTRRQEQWQPQLSRIQHYRERVRTQFQTWLVKDGRNVFSSSHMPFLTPFEHPLEPGDIVHLHWVDQWLDLGSFLRSIPEDIPIVWTMHGINHFTGGCHHYYGCDRFIESCSPCPILRGPFRYFLARRELRRKSTLLRDREFHLVCNSAWTKALAVKSPLSRYAKSVEIIHPGVGRDVFRPYNKVKAKELLGIRLDSLIVGFGAAALGDYVKNVTGFFDLMNRVRESHEVEALVFGPGSIPVGKFSFPIHAVGTISSTHLLSQVYSAMDLFIVTSLFEPFGQVAVEAQACRTPVVCFNVGGLPEAVYQGDPRTIVPVGDIKTMTKVVSHLLDRREVRESLGEKACCHALSEFDMKKLVDKYIQIYRRAYECKLEGNLRKM